MSRRILLIQQEWHREFHRSTQWSYISSLGYVEALRACGADVTLLTTPWLALARGWIQPGAFDQVWLNDLVHFEGPPDALDWVRDLAPIRVGLLGESLRYSAEEVRDLPQLAGREALATERSNAMTHLLFVDEDDARRACARGRAALWLPPAVLRDFVIAEATIAPKGPVGFIGALYPKRQRFFADARIAARVARVAPNDRPADVERRYLEIAALRDEATAARPAEREALHAAYNEALLGVRRDIFERYLAAFAALGATINPPSLVKAYPGRVFEAMARGVPVLTARLARRPGAERLFVPGEEILAFDAEDTDELCSFIDALAAEPDLGPRIARRAHRRILADHTLEGRCALALRFIAESRA